MKKLFIILGVMGMLVANTWQDLGSSIPRPYEKEILSSSEESTTIRFTMSGYHQFPVNTDRGKAYILKAEHGASLLESGHPDLNKITSSLIIPDQSQMKVRVESSEFVEVNNLLVAPSKGNITRDIDPSTIPYTWNESYLNNAFYPSKLTDLNDPYILRDYRGQSVNVYPFQYNPVTQITRIYTEIIVTVYADGNSQENVLSRRSPIHKMDREFKQIYGHHFDNFVQTDSRFNYLDDHGNMLIISYGDFMDEMQSFVNWKNRRGISTEIVNVSNIGSNSSAIEAFVDDYYHTNGLTFLLLVGDNNQIPSPDVGGSKSDPSYGCIDGNDFYFEVIVGRFSANNPSELNTQIERSINYERYPDVDGDWYHHAIGIASNQGTGWGGLDDDEFNQQIIWPMLNNYNYDQYDSFYDPNTNLNGGIEAINAGAGIINYTGHGWIEGWGNGAPLEVSHVNSLTNTNLLPYVITVGCNVGEFNSTSNSFAESWLRATHNGQPTGAIAHVGSTISQSWEPPMHGQYGMNAILTGILESGISHSLGGITANGCMHMNDEASGTSGINETKYWTYFGDPSIVFRTDTPSDLALNVNNAIVVGETELNINTNAIDALAAISLNNELLVSAYAENGQISLDLSDLDLTPGEYDLVVTAYNAVPYEDVLTVVAPDGAYITHDGYNVSNNESNVIVYGNSSEIVLTVENVGVETAQNVSAIISTDDMYVSILDNSVSFGNIAAGGSSQSSDSFEVQALNSIPDGHIVTFDVVYSSSNDSWETSFTVEAIAPVFSVLNPMVIDENGDGTWDAGESATISVELWNSGSASFSNYPGATISSTNPSVALLTDENANTFYGIGENSFYNGTFEYQCDPDTPAGTTVTFTVNWGYSSTSPCNGDCVENALYSFSTTIGLPFNDDVAIPENVQASEIDNGVLVEWDEPVLYDCAADAPYNDSCYGYVIVIDTYCCDTNWDTICENEYEDCLGGVQSSQDGYLTLEERQIRSLHPPVLVNLNNNREEVVGYNVFRDDQFISYVTNTSYFDSNVNSGTEYCYDVTAVYETVQSNHSASECITTEGSPIMPGDLNNDTVLNILDVILLVNMILGLELPNYDVADMNNDESLNVLDIIIIISQILDQKVDDASSAILKIENGKAILNANGFIGGIQMTLSHQSDFVIELTDDSMISEYNTQDNETILIIIMPETDILFESQGEFEIVESIVANSSERIPVILANKMALSSAYPNPFNPSTSFSLYLTNTGHVKVSIYNILGQLVADIANHEFASGIHSFVWNANDLSSGMYFIKAESAGVVTTQKILLMK